MKMGTIVSPWRDDAALALCVIWTYLGQAAFEPDANLSLGAEMNATLRSTRASVPEPTRYSVHVNEPWCITFEFEDGDACRVDFEQYH